MRQEVPRRYAKRMAKSWDGTQNHTEPAYGKLKAEREHKFSSKILCSRMEEAPVTPDFDSSSYAAPCNCIDIGVPVALASIWVESLAQIRGESEFFLSCHALI